MTREKRRTCSRVFAARNPLQAPSQAAMRPPVTSGREILSAPVGMPNRDSIATTASATSAVALPSRGEIAAKPERLRKGRSEWITPVGWFRETLGSNGLMVVGIKAVQDGMKPMARGCCLKSRLQPSLHWDGIKRELNLLRQQRAFEPLKSPLLGLHARSRRCKWGERETSTRIAFSHRVTSPNVLGPLAGALLRTCERPHHAGTNKRSEASHRCSCIDRSWWPFDESQGWFAALRYELLPHAQP